MSGAARGRYDGAYRGITRRWWASAQRLNGVGELVENAASYLGRLCHRCGEFYPIAQVPLHFTRQRRLRRVNSRVNRHSWERGGPLEYITICNRCLQIERDERKHRNRYLDKAKDTIRGHAQKFKMPPKTFSLVHQWKAEQIAHDIEHAEKNGCCYCFHPFAEMGHGLADITVDHYDPRFPPVYGANTRICCATCNKKKGDMTPEQWAQVCLAFRLQEGFLPLLLDDQLPPAPLGQMSLFTPQQWAGIPRKKKDEPG